MMSPAPVFCMGIHKAFHWRSVRSPMECNGPPCLHAPALRVITFIMWRYEVHFQNSSAGSNIDLDPPPVYPLGAW